VKVLVGSASQTEWLTSVEGLYTEGPVSLIAHFKVVGMHIALEKTIQVTPRAGMYSVT